MSEQQDTLLGAQASTPIEQEEEAWRRFNEASRAYYLLVDTDCRPERLERVVAVMGEWARQLTS